MFRTFEIVERRSFSRGEGLPTALTFEILDVMVLSAFAITNKSMEGFIGDTKVFAYGIETSKALC